MACKFSGVFLPIVVAGVCIASGRRGAIRRLAIMAGASLIVIEASYLFSQSPLMYFRNARLVNANHIQNYPFYLFGQMKPGGWWYYFLAAFVLKATIPVLFGTIL